MRQTLGTGNTRPSLPHRLAAGTAVVVSRVLARSHLRGFHKHLLAAVVTPHRIVFWDKERH